MKKNWLTVLGILFIVAGTVLSYFANWSVTEITGFAVTMFGAGLASANLWSKKSDTAKTYLSVLSIALVGAGAFIAGFTGLLAESTITTIMASVFGLVAIIAGLIVSAVNKSK